jgi:hypothetical protein
VKASEKFVDSLEVAVRESENDGFYHHVMSLLNAQGSRVTLTAPSSFQSRKNDHIMDAAVRDALGDMRRGKGERSPDAKFEGLPIEVKHSTEGFTKLPTDSRALRNTDKKWYLFLQGEIKVDRPGQYMCWLMRSDALYRQVSDSLREKNSLFLPTIDPDDPEAAEKIENEIRSISADLARAILQKSIADEKIKLKTDTMSLRKNIGVNRVRFDIKFESLLRDVVSSMLKG